MISIESQTKKVAVVVVGVIVVVAVIVVVFVVSLDVGDDVVVIVGHRNRTLKFDQNRANNK